MEKRILAKCGRKKAKCGRKKAAFGTESGAILAAAGINAAATAAASITSANATKDAARSQANATITAAQKQAQAIKDQTTRAKEYQMQSQEFIKEQNAENRELQQDIQMQLQMLTGQQNVNDRLEASKIVVRNGGMTKPRYSLRGNNMAFKVTDGGYVMPIGKTNEGFNLFEIRGNDHEHYHKAPGGKNKTGVGIKFADGNVIEGEGNQNTNQGEYMLQTPNASYFISKHSIAGFNPAKAVNNGMHPLVAYNIQEKQKQINGITDDGKKISSPVGNNKKLAGGLVPNIYDTYNQIGPKTGVDTIGDTAVGVAYASKDENKMKCGGKKRTLKCGGKVRKKAYNGIVYPSYDPTSDSFDIYKNWFKNPNYNAESSVNYNQNNKTVTPKSSRSFWNNIDANVVGSGISSLSNLGGAWITSSANNYAANKLAEAYNQAANITADAYRSLKTIDLDSIKRKDFDVAHVMPALQAPISQAAAPKAIVDRQLQRRLSNAAKYNTSGAAAQTIMNSAEVDAQDAKARIDAADQKQMQDIRQNNANRGTQSSIENAHLDAEASKQYTDAYLNLLQLKNEIDNKKILGSAGALAEGAINATGAIANARAANATAWNSAIINSGQSFANTLSAMAARKADTEMALLGSSGDTRSLYYANNGSYNDAKNHYNSLIRQYDLIKNSTKPEDKDTKSYLKRLINMVATGRNFDTV